VANLFKVFHHEIVALNPGLDLEGQLRPGTAVTVYRKPRDPSESIGLPSAGSLENGIPLPEGPGRTILALPYKTWGTARTVALLDGVLRQWAERKRGVQPILVGNLSSRHGGRLAPHSTHQSGRDVDLGYVQRLQRGEEHNWREMTADNLDAQQTWALIDLLLQTGAVEVIYIDRALQKLLYDHAKERGLMSSGQLAELMEYPKAVGQGSPLIQHVPGHTDHLHVRFECGPAEARCRSKS
jgi:murein endopeptidase